MRDVPGDVRLTRDWCLPDDFTAYLPNRQAEMASHWSRHLKQSRTWFLRFATELARECWDDGEAVLATGAARRWWHVRQEGWRFWLEPGSRPGSTLQDAIQQEQRQLGEAMDRFTNWLEDDSTCRRARLIHHFNREELLTPSACCCDVCQVEKTEGHPWLHVALSPAQTRVASSRSGDLGHWMRISYRRKSFSVAYCGSSQEVI